MAAAVVAALATAVPLTAGTAFAAAPAAADFVIPARQKEDPYTSITGVTAGGFLRYDRSGYGHVWTKYGEDAPTRTVPHRTAMRPAGPDTVAFLEWTTGKVTFHTPADGTERVITAPAGQSLQGVAGEAVLTSVTENGQKVLHWLTLDGGVPKDVKVPGLTAKTWFSASGSNQRGALVADDAGKSWWVGRDGTVRPAPKGARVHGDWIVVAHAPGSDAQPWSYSAWDVRGPLDDASAKRIPEPFVGSGGDTIGVAGGDLLLHHSGKIHAVPLDGGASRVLLQDVTSVAGGPDGGAAVSVREGGMATGVHTVQPGADGRAAAVKRSVIPAVFQEIRKMAMDNGRLYSAETYPNTYYTDITEYVMPAAGAPAAGPRKGRGWSQAGCDTGPGVEQCTDIVATGDGRLVYGGRVESEMLTVPTTDNRHLGNRTAHPLRNTLQASGRYAAYVAADDPARPAEVFDLDRRKNGRKITAPGGTFALSGSWLWRKKSAGVLEAVDVRTGSVVRTDTVANCDIKVLDAWASSVYWKCDKDSGVYDTGTRKTQNLPAHNTARVGDGFIAWEKDGVLNTTALRGTSGTRALGKPRHPAPGEGWTVDRQSGRIAYTDRQYAVHVFNSGVPAGTFAAIDRETPADFDVAGGTKTWSGAWYLNRTAASWTLTIRARAGGAVVRTTSGGEARGAVRLTWDGTDNAGDLLATGAYDWTLTGKPAGGQGPELKSTGTIRLTGGTAVRRDFVGKDGFGDLVTLDSKGTLSLHQGDGKGGLGGKATGTGWTSATAVVPLGDLEGDGCNDLLVRNASGELRSYHPACGTGPTPATRSRAFGTGWNQYDVLTSPGGADLLARQASTGDLYLYAHDGLTTLKPRVKLAGNFKQYKQLAGAGDLNGDGHGDLLAVDAAGTLWRFDGTGRQDSGAFKARVQVNGAGWANGRNLLIGVGDISGDGRADVISRNAAGELLRNNGDGKGGLQATTRIATGFGSYKGIY
ncbi:FlgD immunoglobulin-like domain containing protein [Streptomyces sp. NPDC048603]|uniref:FlgD immunoglobulin-like domain containing protein n=1 Tax=Streptomyces sp. NPDC048603 TaxID=3365577 RepID=UPI003711D222